MLAFLSLWQSKWKEAEIDPHYCADARQKKKSPTKKETDRPYLIIEKDYLHENII